MLCCQATNHHRQYRPIQSPNRHAVPPPRSPSCFAPPPIPPATCLHRPGVATFASHRVRRWCARAFCATAVGGVMVVTPELRAQILRLYLAEHWRVGTIARQLHLHRDTVRRVLAISCVLRALSAHPKPSKVPPSLADQRHGRRHRPLRHWRCWTKSDSGYGLATADRFSRNCAGTAKSQRQPTWQTLTTRTCRFRTAAWKVTSRHSRAFAPFTPSPKQTIGRPLLDGLLGLGSCDGNIKHML